MLSFECDYNKGAHEAILQRLLETNSDSQPGYGQDEYTLFAKEKIKAVCGCADAQVFFLGGGTQTNQIVIDAMLRSYEGVIACDTGHVALHEAGAIEYAGHKVLTLPCHLGKLSADEVKTYLEHFEEDETKEHMVRPGMVYISHPTEWGTLYTREELTALSAVCREYDIPLYMDGARLGYGIMSFHTDVTLKDIASLCDVLYIGGTKVGALCGEAVVFPNGNAPKGFFTMIKQHGALFAKGRLLGVQFDTLFTDDLYFTISRHAIEMAEELKRILDEKGYKFAWESPTNQQFVILEEETMKRLSQQVRFEIWEKRPDGKMVVRFATSWATKTEDLQALKDLL